jgi:signal transduction histidine kinase
MDKENYEDTVEVLDMLEGNLKKVGEHGQNTTRTLKAMEEMLKDRSGGMVEMDLCTVLRQDKEILENYYADDIKTYQIAINIDLPKEPLMINGNAEQLSKAFMSLLGNSVYALCKKAQRLSFQPEISVKVLKKGSSVVLSFCDNGVGIEQTIIEKVFDPFFTTKTTGEAAGVGLYLSREIVQNHGGDIVVESNQNEFTTFTITLPNV